MWRQRRTRGKTYGKDAAFERPGDSGIIPRKNGVAGRLGTMIIEGRRPETRGFAAAENVT